MLLGPSRDIRRQDAVRICASAYNRSPVGVVDDGFAALSSDVQPDEEGHEAFDGRYVSLCKPTVELLSELSTHKVTGHSEFGAHAQIATTFKQWDEIVRGAIQHVPLHFSRGPWASNKT